MIWIVVCLNHCMGYDQGAASLAGRLSAFSLNIRFRFSGHRKAVSYVRYLNTTELVSASTDSTLRLWDTKACTAARVFNGHNNEKNFVGLSVDADFMACGSETNEVSLAC